MPLPVDLGAIVALLAVLKAGGTLVPLAPALPESHLAALRPDLVLDLPGEGAWMAAAGALPGSAAGSGARAIAPEAGGADAAALHAVAAGSPACRVAWEAGGAVMGIDLPHRELARRFAALQRLDILDGASAGLGTGVPGGVVKARPVVFAEGEPEPVRDVLLPLVLGATLVLDGAGADGAGALPAEATVLLTDGPALARRLAVSGLPVQVRTVLVTGDVPPARGLAEAVARGGAALRSLVDCGVTGLWSLVGTGEAAPLLSPLPGVPIALAGSRPGPLPAGAIGELWLGEPLSRATGRRARRLPGGALELLGHARNGAAQPEDDDAGEVAAALRRHPSVWLAGVTLANGGSTGVATVTIGAGQETGAAGLRGFLHRLLPGPAASLRLEVRPAAPGPDGVPAALQGPSAPRSPLELEVVQIWEELFGVRPIGVHDDFFALGGHSLLAIRLAAALRHRFGQDLSLTSLLAASTVEKIAALLRGREEAGPDLPLVAIRGGGSKPPLFCLHPAGGGVLCYVDLAYHLGADQPVYGLQAAGWGDERPPLDSVEDMARCYVEAVRRARPRGPYALAGWSFGGFVAYEMARQLRLAGEDVSLLALLDTATGVDGPPEVADDAQILGDLLDGALPVAVEELRRLGALDAQLAHVLALARQRGLLPAGVDLRSARRLVEVYRASHRAALGFTPQPLPGRLTLFRAEQPAGPLVELARRDPTYGWGSLAAEVEIRSVLGRHENLVRRPWVESLAAALAAALDAPAGVQLASGEHLKKARLDRAEEGPLRSNRST
jgi:thioesterase domain-containing protein